MQNNSQQTKSSDIEKIGIEQLYDKFTREKRRYAPSLFCVGEKTKRKRKEPVSLALYKKIILEYLKMYFFDFYMRENNKSIYFPLGGFLKKVRYKKWVRRMGRSNKKNQVAGGDSAIGMFWYMRPSKKMYYMTTIKKLTGSSNRIPKLEAMYNSTENKDLLPIFNKELTKTLKNKTLYLCTLT